jgi:hypothetical protein
MFSMSTVFGIVFGIGGLALAVAAGIMLYRDPKPSERRSARKGTAEARTA